MSDNGDTTPDKTAESGAVDESAGDTAGETAGDTTADSGDQPAEHADAAGASGEDEDTMTGTASSAETTSDQDSEGDSGETREAGLAGTGLTQEDEDSTVEIVVSSGAAGIPAEFDEFVTVLREKDPDLEGLEPPADEVSIAAAETSLGITFPPLFRSFLKFCNGGSAHEICIYGVGTNDEFDLVGFNDRAHRDELPGELVGFASTIVGDVFCFRTDQPDSDGDMAILLFDIETGQAVEVSPNFRDWLDRLPTLEQEVAAAQQPQPMTVDEWESFVKREREKLRKLSKTPASELYMPDPDEVRAELGNKIPVDPRHLRPKG